MRLIFRGVIAPQERGWWPCVVASGREWQDRRQPIGQGGRSGATGAHASASYLCSHLSSLPAQPVSPATPAPTSREGGRLMPAEATSDKIGSVNDVSWLRIVPDSAASALASADVVLGVWDSHDNALSNRRGMPPPR